MTDMQNPTTPELDLAQTTDLVRRLTHGQWKSTLKIGAQLARMVDARLWSQSPGIAAWAAADPAVTSESATARHLTAQGVPYSRQRVSQLVAAHRLSHDLGATRVAPTSERQIRSLVSLPIADAVRIWGLAVEMTGGQPTASQVAELVPRAPRVVKVKPAGVADLVADLSDADWTALVASERIRRQPAASSDGRAKVA